MAGGQRERQIHSVVLQGDNDVVHITSLTHGTIVELRITGPSLYEASLREATDRAVRYELRAAFPNVFRSFTNAFYNRSAYQVVGPEAVGDAAFIDEENRLEAWMQAAEKVGILREYPVDQSRKQLKLVNAGAVYLGGESDLAQEIIQHVEQMSVRVWEGIEDFDKRT